MYIVRRPFKTKVPQPIGANLVCGLVNAPGAEGDMSGALLHFNADEPRLENHLLRIDFRDVELRGRTRSVKELEHFVRRAVPVHIADVGVDVREREIRLVLRERVERYAFRQDLAHDLVVALELRLLVGVHRIAEKDPCPADAVSGELDARGVRELGAAVGEDDREEFHEQFVPEFRIQAVEHRRDVLRAFVRDEDADHEPRVEPVERQEADAAGTPDDEIHVDRTDAVMVSEELLVVIVRAVHITTGLHLVLIFLRERFPSPHRSMYSTCWQNRLQLRKLHRTQGAPLAGQSLQTPVSLQFSR